MRKVFDFLWAAEKCVLFKRRLCNGLKRCRPVSQLVARRFPSVEVCKSGMGAFPVPYRTKTAREIASLGLRRTARRVVDLNVRVEGLERRGSDFGVAAGTVALFGTVKSF